MERTNDRVMEVARLTAQLKNKYLSEINAILFS